MRGGQIDYANPVADHPLNRGRVLWLYGLPRWSGGTQWHDLCRRAGGTLTGGPTWAPTPYGDGLTLDGVNDYVAFPAGAAGVGGPLTVGATVYLSAYSSFGQVVAKADAASPSNRNYLLDVGNNNGLFRFAVYSGATGSTESLVTSGTAIGLGRWVRLLGTYDGGTLRVYRDGEPVGTTSASVVPAAAVGTLAVGRLGGFAANYLPGVVADVSLWCRGLSADEVRLDYGQSRRQYPDLLRRTRTRYFLPASVPPTTPAGNLLLLGVG